MQDLKKIGRDDSEWRWSCGHQDEGVCGRCYGDLVIKAEQLREENDMLREAILMTGNLLLEAGSQP